MEVIMIETKVFKAMQERFEAFARKVDELYDENSDKNMKKWLDNQDVCQILNITKRTLQTYRENVILPYTMIGHKIYYKTEDVERVINNLKMK